eukprot:3112306-Amphidinium_carterae.1
MFAQTFSGGGGPEKSTEFRQMDGMRVAILHEDDTELPDGELPVVKFKGTRLNLPRGVSQRYPAVLVRLHSLRQLPFQKQARPRGTSTRRQRTVFH